MMTFIKLVKELVHCGMREDKAITLVAKAFGVDPQTLKCSVQKAETH